MPVWASSVVPEGALMRRMKNEQDAEDARRAVSPPSPSSDDDARRRGRRSSPTQRGSGFFRKNPQYSSDPVTRNMQSRALAANGTYGARQPVIPQHVRSVVATLRRNVEEMKKFAAEVPILTTAEMPAAIKRLAALLYAQTIAVDDLCRFTEDELRFASSRFYDLVADLQEAETAPYVSLEKNLQIEKKLEDIMTTLFSLRNTNNNTSSSSAAASSSTLLSSSSTASLSSAAAPSQSVEVRAESGILPAPFSKEEQDHTSTKAAPAAQPPAAPQMAASQPLPAMTYFAQQQQPQATNASPIVQQVQKIANNNNNHVTIVDALREVNSFRSLYTMLAGLANITGASEGRLFLYPSEEMLAQDPSWFSEEQQKHQEEEEAMLSQSFSMAASALKHTHHRHHQHHQHHQKDALEDEEEAFGGMLQLEGKKLHLVAQVQANSFSPNRTATAPRDVVKIAESVALTRCSVNLTPGIARVRASFTSLVAVPLFVSKQPESAVLGVLVLTNKRSTTSNSSVSSSKAELEKKKHHHNKHQQQQQQDEGEENHNTPEDEEKRQQPEQNQDQEGRGVGQSQHSNFDNSAGSSSWVTRGFFVDDEHKAVITAEMMTWLIEKVPLGVVMRGAVRLSPAGFAEEWARWACPAAQQSQHNSANSNNNNNTAAAAAGGGGGGVSTAMLSQFSSTTPVLDAEMAFSMVPRRRFVFRTEDPREVAATGALKIDSGVFAKTRSVIGPESGEYLINIAHSHRKLERAKGEADGEIQELRDEVERLKAELEQQRTKREQAEVAAHSMQVACDRIVRRTMHQQTQVGLSMQQHHAQTSKYYQQSQTTAATAGSDIPPQSPTRRAGGGGGGAKQPHGDNVAPGQPTSCQQHQQQQAPRPPSSNLHNLARRATPPPNASSATGAAVVVPPPPLDAGALDADLRAYAEASAPYSTASIGIRRSSSSSGSQHKTQQQQQSGHLPPSTSRPSTQGSSTGTPFPGGGGGSVMDTTAMTFASVDGASPIFAASHTARPPSSSSNSLLVSGSSVVALSSSGALPPPQLQQQQQQHQREQEAQHQLHHHQSSSSSSSPSPSSSPGRVLTAAQMLAAGDTQLPMPQSSRAIPSFHAPPPPSSNKKKAPLGKRR